MKTILVEIDVEGAPQAIKNIDDLENAIGSLEGELKKADFGSKEFKQLSKELTKARTELKNTELALEALDSEQVASEFGALTGSVGDLTGAFVLLGGEDSPVAQVGEKISTAIGISMAFKGAIEGISAGRKLLNNALATSNTLQKINNAATATAGTVMKLFGGSVNTTSIAFKGLRTAIIATGIGALVVAVGLLIANFDKLEKMLRTTTASQDAMNEATQMAIDKIGDEIFAAGELQNILKDETKTREEKVKAVKELQAEYPNLLSNVDAEKDGIDAVSKALEKNIELIMVKAQMEALAELEKEKILENLKKETEMRTGQNVGIADMLFTLPAETFGLVKKGAAQKTANILTQDAINKNNELINVYKDKRKELEGVEQALISEGAAVQENTDLQKKNNEIALNAIKKIKKAQEDFNKKLEEAQKLAEKDAEAAFKLRLAKKESLAKELEDFIAIEKMKRNHLLKNEELTKNERRLIRFESEQEILKITKEFAEKEAELKEEELQKEREHQQNLADIRNEFLNELEAENEIYRQSFLTEQQIEIEAVQDKYFRLKELAIQHGEDTTQLELNEEKAKADIREKFAKEELANQRQLNDQKLTIASDALGAINGLVQAFAKEDEESARKAFNVNKAVGIAQAIISTAQGVINAYANPVDVASGVAFAKSAIIAATGAAQIAVISKTKFESPEQAPAPPSPSTSGGTGAFSQPPAFNVVGQSGFNQIATALGQGQPPIQAFVVSQDVTTAQQLDNAIIQTATF